MEDWSFRPRRLVSALAATVVGVVAGVPDVQEPYAPQEAVAR